MSPHLAPRGPGPSDHLPRWVSVRGHGRVHLPCPAEDAAVEVVQAGEAVRREGVARGGGSYARLAVHEDVAPLGGQLRRHLEHLAVRLLQVDEGQRDDLRLGLRSG